MKISTLALMALIVSGSAAQAQTTTVLTCKLSIAQDDEWESCGEVSLKWPDARREDSTGQGIGLCADFKVNFHNMLPAEGKRQRNDFLVMVSRETVRGEFDEATMIKLGEKLPAELTLQPYFSDGKNRSAKCISQEVLN